MFSTRSCSQRQYASLARSFGMSIEFAEAIYTVLGELSGDEIDRNQDPESFGRFLHAVRKRKTENSVAP